MKDWGIRRFGNRTMWELEDPRIEGHGKWTGGRVTRRRGGGVVDALKRVAACAPRRVRACDRSKAERRRGRLRQGMLKGRSQAERGEATAAREQERSTCSKKKCERGATCCVFHASCAE
eukprot:6172973-Pleurochrysis_carterae.AAC.3